MCVLTLLYIKRTYTLEPTRNKKLRRPGIEPGSTAWKATMLTITPPTLESVC